MSISILSKMEKVVILAIAYKEVNNCRKTFYRCVVNILKKQFIYKMLYNIFIKRKLKTRTSTTSITEETEEQQTPEEEGQADNQASNDDSGLADNHKKPGSTGYDNIQWGEFIKWLLSNLSKLALLRLI